MSRGKKILIMWVIFIIGGVIFIIGGGIISPWRFILKSKKPNVLIITCDALRLDHLGAYGYPRNTSPNIDALTKDGFLFTKAISQAPWTTPSISSLMTSTYPHTHEMNAFNTLLSPSIPTLAQVLKASGYTTAFITGHGGLSQFEALNFDTFVNIEAGANVITRKAINWLTKQSGHKTRGYPLFTTPRNERPFFLHIHYLEPHRPYISPPPYNSMYLHDKYSNCYKDIPKELLLESILGEIITSCDPDYYIALYDGRISFVDHEIGVLIEALKKVGLYDNTLIILSADHGEDMGEHGLWFEHGCMLFDPVIRVPLIIKLPARIKVTGRLPDVGQPYPMKIEALVELIDIMPTVLELLRIPSPEGIDGVSLLPLISGGDEHSSKSLSRSYACSEFFFLNIYGVVCIRTDKWKLIYEVGSRKGYYEAMKDWNPSCYAVYSKYLALLPDTNIILYDLEDDPDERNNLSDQKPELVSSLTDTLKRHFGIEKSQDLGALLSAIRLAKTSTTVKNYNPVKEPEVWEIDSESRTVFPVYPTTTISLILKVPEEKNISVCYIAVDPKVWDKEGDGVEFELYIEFSETHKELIFSKYIDPKNNLQDRKWHPVIIDMSKYRGKEVSLVAVTKPGPKGDARQDWGGWTEPSWTTKYKEIDEETRKRLRSLGYIE